MADGKACIPAPKDDSTGDEEGAGSGARFSWSASRPPDGSTRHHPGIGHLRNRPEVGNGSRLGCCTNVNPFLCDIVFTARHAMLVASPSSSTGIVSKGPPGRRSFAFPSRPPSSRGLVFETCPQTDTSTQCGTVPVRVNLTWKDVP